MKWTVPRIWDEGTCFIIGGGASIRKQFNIPEQTTVEGYSPYLSLLHDKHVIGVNMAYTLGQWVDIIFFGDKKFLLHNKQALINHPAVKVGCHPTFDGHSWVKYLSWEENKKQGLTTNPKKVVWNGNSGAAAINLAVHTGVRKIVLLGFDMNVDEKQNQWWHKYYKGRSLEKGMKTFARHMLCFPDIATDARKIGIEIVNANPDSAIKDFPKVNIKEVL